MKDKGGKESCLHCGKNAKKQRNAIALPIRTVLNKRFLVGRVLGKPGGFGITYLAWDLMLETTAAIKEFLPLSAVSREPGNTSVRANSRQDQDFFNQGMRIFLKEAKTLAQFSHPNIVRIRDCFTANNTAYLVMEYHQGQPLDEVIVSAGGRLSEDRSLDIMLPILDGLHAVHKKGFLHRDIKPQNIYLTDKGVPVLLDFGASRFALADSTQTMTVMLSTGYAPFEQYHKKGKQGPWSDIYSCGATLYFMTTGTMPTDAIERQHDEKLPPPRLLNPQLSETFSLAIMQAMSIDAQSRPRNIHTFKQLLMGNTYRSPAKIRSETDPGILRSNSPLPVLRSARQPVEIRYTSSNNHTSVGRLFLYAGLIAVLWFSWSTRQMLEDSYNRNPPPLEWIGPMDAGGFDLPGEDATIEYVEFIDAPNNTSDFVSMDSTAEEHYILPDPESVNMIRQPNQPMFMPAPAFPVTPEFAIAACHNKNPHAHCWLDSPQGKHPGICLPVEQEKLACFPEPPPIYPPHPQHRPPLQPPPQPHRPKTRL
jgi:serine/threonine protein kinase